MERTKAELLERAAAEALSKAVTARTPAGTPPDSGDAERADGGAPVLGGDELRVFLRRYYRQVDPHDLSGLGSADILGAALSHYRLAARRPQGTAAVRVYNPTAAADGWTSRHSVVEVVTDDMPYLVDSVTMHLSDKGRGIHVLIHPQLVVRRDLTGSLTEVVDTSDPAKAPADAHVESWMHIEIDRDSDAASLGVLEHDLRRILRDVREAVEDADKMRDTAIRIADLLPRLPPLVPIEEASETADLLRWLVADHFTFLGYREYVLAVENGEDVLKSVPGTGLGILRSDAPVSTSFRELSPEGRAKAKLPRLLTLTKANSRATVHRPAYLDYVGIRMIDERGAVVGERRFLGLFSASAYLESVMTIPVLRRKAEEVLRRAGFPRASYSGKALRQVLEGYPRDELFQMTVDELLPIATSVLHLQERRRLRLYLRSDDYGRFVSALVYIPRDRYTTQVRKTMEKILREELGGLSIDHTAQVSESVLARVHFIVRVDPATVGRFDRDRIERRLVDSTRSWADDFADELVEEYGEEHAPDYVRRYTDALPEAYKEDFDARTAVDDLRRLEALSGDDALGMNIYTPNDAEPGERRFKIYKVGTPLSLSAVLPILQRMGVEVVDERPYGIEPAADSRSSLRSGWIYDFGLRSAPSVAGSLDQARELFQEAFAAVWRGDAESDGFNTLVLLAGLSWRDAAVLRAYAKYLRQGTSTFSQDYMEQALTANAAVARLLVRLFHARLAPDAPTSAEVTGRDEATTAIMEEIEGELDAVSSLDQDRILRAFLATIQATLRTNYFQRDDDRHAKPYMSIKLNPQVVPDLPAPRPRYEVWVYSPRVEGVHLRFGSVARGGLRWSDRREDFRTEVLGLVKAQMVKNAVIVPVGAKGGFVVKRPPELANRDAWLAEGVACYRTFIRGMLDITDNLGQTGDGGAMTVVPPRDVVRHDGDDTYLVVAADKGTATFSDIANEVAAEYGFWLGDAFASGGSAGYDHKAIGITARGAWESVKRHFREMGRDCQKEDFTVIGIGDMSGDVFGNGMLLSEHIGLVAAFDHRHIFLDPDPDPASTYAERRRLFELPRSSWADYNAELISPGGGVFPRTAKSIDISAQARRALGLDDDVEQLTPPELIRAILLAPVDLFWNGGIGTYVKASTEPNAGVGDRGNDPVRVNGGDLRCKCVGEGGNLGFTQLGRIEYARAGGRINTDALDNSAGVDTSDHEVNIKILLDGLVRSGELTEQQRNGLLAEMTDEVAELVLRDNYDQNVAVAMAVAQAPAMLHVHARFMRSLERKGELSRPLEFLPTDRQLKELQQTNAGLSAPEFAVLLAYAKITLHEKLQDSDLPDDPYLIGLLHDYFPSAIRDQFGERLAAHPLRRQIITTSLVNGVVNSAGTTFTHRLGEELGVGAADIVRAHIVARTVFDQDGHWRAVEALDTVVPADVLVQMRLSSRRLVERSARWLLHNRRLPLDLAAEVRNFASGAAEVVALLPKIVHGLDAVAFEREEDALVAAGVPTDVAVSTATMTPAYSALDIVEVARDSGRDVATVAEVYFDLADRLPLARLLARVNALSRTDRWKTMARAALRDDLYAAHAGLTFDVLAFSGDTPAARFDAWREHNAAVVRRASQLLDEILAGDTYDLATMSVAMRVVRTMLRRGGEAL